MAKNLPLFITPAQLDAARQRSDVQLVAVADADTHAQLRIPGSLRVALTDFVTSRPPVAGLLPDDDTLARVFGAAGLSSDAHIVAYDHVVGTQAARLLYTLHTIGHEATSILDGGLNAWRADGFDLDRGEITPPAPGTFEITPNAQRIGDRGWISEHLDDDDLCIIDVRSAAEYVGSDVRSARGGHIPGAIHFDWRELLQSDGRLKPETELRAIVAEHGISPENASVSYCQSHMRSSFTYLVLRLLGHDKARGYPGAWSDWGNRDDTSVSTSAPGAEDR